jgi:hypothetical protein
LFPSGGRFHLEQRYTDRGHWRRASAAERVRIPENVATIQQSQEADMHRHLSTAALVAAGTPRSRLTIRLTRQRRRRMIDVYETYKSYA